eukprot:CAMPEP_0203775998 /NCGR_PEP_ID=MMETSP0099_2-20121227/6466_1 /ASSEMBLY_ACC=CAM_ASM_000209 /TAXON_ID=96639 /ORGANISM=" , Strain NY0313808BC1" /LENGTH=49 /DNA_ID= /DNA_START= /DNA_END= /DNA_ORIENTATION=
MVLFLKRVGTFFRRNVSYGTSSFDSGVAYLIVGVFVYTNTKIVIDGRYS